MTDDKLIERIRDGDEHSAEELITRYYSAILRYCRLHCVSDEMAEDLFVASALCEHRTLQQTFARACIKLVFESNRFDFSALEDEPWRLPLV